MPEEREGRLRHRLRLREGPARVDRPLVPQAPVSLGTDGFGRSEGRAELRDFFEVDARHIAAAALSALAGEGRIEAAAAQQAIADLGIDPEASDPAVS